MKPSKYSISFLVIVLFAMCSINIRPNNNHGGASETVNATVIIQDTVIEIQTTSEKDLEMEVCIIKDSYSPSDNADMHNSSIISNSDALNKSNSPGIYNIFLFDKDSLLSCSFFKVQLFKDEKDTLTDTLSASASINGSVIMSDSVSEQQVPVLVYLRGTPFFKQLTNNYSYSFDFIPRGTYSIVAEVVKVNKESEEAKKAPLTVGSDSLDSSQQVSKEITLESGEPIKGLNLRLSD